MANTLRGLDQEELDFLDQVNQKKKINDRLKNQEIEKELLEFKAARDKVVKHVEIPLRKIVQVEVAPKNNQKVLVKRKSSLDHGKNARKIVEYSDSD